MKVSGKVLVVTGAGSGIGRAVALEALRRGARVAAVDLNPATLYETAARAHAGDWISTHVLDITDKAAVDALPAAVAASHGAVDGLVHCAGIIQPFVRLKDLDDAAIERVFNVNWWGTLHLTRAFLPVLLDRPEGHIVNTSSMGGFLPVPGETIYGASKAAVKLLTEGLHAECAGTNVHVTVVFPGAVDIPVSPDAAAAQAHRTTPAATAATTILDGMEKDAFRVLIGRDARLMDGLYRFNPKRAAGFIANQMQDLLKA